MQVQVECGKGDTENLRTNIFYQLIELEMAGEHDIFGNGGSRRWERLGTSGGLGFPKR